MTDPKDLEARLAALERDVALLKQPLRANETSAEWLDRVSGSMKNHPEFDEVVALGQAARRADLPKGAAPDAA